MSKKYTILHRPAGITSKILWDANSSISSDIVEDSTWIAHFESKTDPTNIVCKAGNQDHSLDKFLKIQSYSTTDVAERKLKISEYGLKRRYR